MGFFFMGIGSICKHKLVVLYLEPPTEITCGDDIMHLWAQCHSHTLLSTWYKYKQPVLIVIKHIEYTSRFTSNFSQVAQILSLIINFFFIFPNVAFHIPHMLAM